MNDLEKQKVALEASLEELWFLLNYKMILSWLSGEYLDTSRLLWVSSIEITEMTFPKKKRSILRKIYQKLKKMLQRKKEKKDGNRRTICRT